MRPTRPLATLAVAALVLLPAPMRAQVKLEVTPFFVSYYPLEYLTYVDGANNERQEAGPGLGVALTYRFDNMWAVEAQAVYVSTGIIFRCFPGCANFSPPTNGRLILLNGRVLFQPRRTNIYFALGAGTIMRSREAWEVTGIGNLSSVAGIVGFGVRARVSPTWGFKIGAELHVYETDPDGPRPYYQKKMQKDVFVTIGVPINLIGK